MKGDALLVETINTPAAAALRPRVTHLGCERESYVGRSTVMTILGNKVAPGLLDQCLAHTGYESQQTGGPVSPDRPSNLFHPVPGDRRAHGRFNARAETWTLSRCGWISAIGIGLGISAVIASVVYKSRG